MTTEQTLPTVRPKLREILDRLKAQCERWQVVGDYALGERNVPKLEFVIVPKTGKGQDREDFFAVKTLDFVDEEIAKLLKEGALEKQGESLVFNGTIIKLVLHKVKPYGFASACVKFTGPKNFLIAVACSARGLNLSWIPEAGFRNKKGEFIQPKTEQEFFEVLRLPWTPPEQRKVGIIFPNGKPSTDEPLTKDEFLKWAHGCKWNFSKCGGEPHEFTLRNTAKDDDMFLRVISQIHRFGYDAHYQGKHYRYLDLDGSFYFTMGYRLDETQLINRKQLAGTEARGEREWRKNLSALHLLTIRR